MRKNLSSDDDDDDFDRPSPLLQTQRFTKPGTIGTKNFHTIQTKSKHNEGTNLNLNLNGVNDDNDKDSLNDSDDDTSTKTGRSSSSLTTSQLTPKPKERSFLKKDTEKPKVKPRYPGNSDDDDDDNERNVFGKTKTEPSPRHQILSLREEEERNQSFMKTFANDKKRQSPTDMFSSDRISDIRKDRTKFSNDHDNKKRTDSDDENLTNKQSKHKDFIKSRHSSTSSEQSQTQKPSSRSKGTIDQSDNDDDFSKKQSQRQSFKKEKQSSHDSVQDTDSNVIQHQLSSSRPGSASKKEIDSARRSSYCEDQDSIIPSTTTINQKPQSRPTSAKSNTTRQQTQSAIDIVTSANVPPTLDPLTSNNEALAAALQPSPLPPSPPPRSSAKLPPRPKSNLNKTTPIGGINKKQPFKIPSRYQEITSRVDNGRTSTSTTDLTRSIERALQKELKSQTLPRPQSARTRKLSATSNHNGSQRRRSSSAYEHVQPRIDTNRSINFDELDTSKLRNDSGQTIKDAVYLEWLKNKEDKRKREKEELKHWQEKTAKLVDKSTVERRIRQEAQKLERWRQEKDKEIIEKKRLENEFKRKEKEQEEQKQKQKKNDAKVGFEDWKTHKDEHLQEQIRERHNKKTEIEQRQEEKQKKVFEAEKAYEKWTNKKKEQTKKFSETQKHVRQDQLKKLRENEETKFLSAQEAYEKWLQDKDKYEIDEKLNTKRRNSLTNKQQQQQVPFLPGGSQKNTGKIRHNVW